MANSKLPDYKRIPTSSLTPYVNNSRTHSDAQVNQIAASIKEFGFTNPVLIDEQGVTQQNKGGLTDIYLTLGTYVKSFYSVMVEPSCVKVALMGVRNKRLHHQIKWNACTPKIMRESVKNA